MIYVIWTSISVFFATISQMLLTFESRGKVFISRTFQNRTSHIFLMISFLPFFVLAAFRFDVGTDYETYVRYQIPWVLRGAKDSVALLYRYVIIFGESLGSTQYVFLLTHLILVTFMFLSVKKASMDYGMSVFLFTASTFYSFSLNAMRQSVATVIVLFAITYLPEDWKKFAFWFVIGYLFHSSVIILLVLVVVAWIAKYYNFPRYLYLIVAPLLYLIAPMATSLAEKISIKLNFYSFYFSTNYASLTDKLAIIFLAFSIFISLLANQTDTYKGKLTHYLVHLTGVGLLFLTIARSIPNAGRFSYFFWPIQILLVPNLLKQIPDKLTRILLSITVIVAYCAFFSYRILYQNQNATLPYQWIQNWRF